MSDLAAVELAADEARALTDEIRQRLDGLLPLIKRAFEGRADRALGYDSWQAYCSAELNDVRVPVGERPAMVAELRSAGMSQRAIGSAIGVDAATVNRDLRRVADATPDAPPTTPVVGLDGKRYASPPQPSGRYLSPPSPDPAAEDRRQRRVATHQLCETVVAVAQMRGFDTGWKYDPAEVLPGRAVTAEVISDARQAIDELAKIWYERKLP